jgi:site-specific DNA-methyltransferase (adenine-specific)
MSHPSDPEISEDDVAYYLNRIFYDHGDDSSNGPSNDRSEGSRNGPSVDHFNDPSVDHSNGASVPHQWEITQGDCLEILKTVPVGSVRLAFADSPYNAGLDYGEGAKADRLPPDRYLDWGRQWIEAVPQILTDDGSFWVLISSEWADEFGCLLRRTGMHRRSWVIWHESFGVNNANGFTRSTRHLFHMAKDPKNFVFHSEPVTRPSARQVKYNDKRANPAGRLWDDAWGIDPPIPRVCGTFKERVAGFPTQLPLALLTPIIGCSSDPGDLVLDPFCGSGTTGVAAIQLGRRFLGIEKSADFARVARVRLASTSEPQLERKASAQPFEPDQERAP